MIDKVTEQKTDKKVLNETRFENEIKISEWQLISEYISKIATQQEYDFVLKQFKRVALVAKLLPISRDKILVVMKWILGGTNITNNTFLDVLIRVGLLVESEGRLTATKKLIEYLRDKPKALSDYEKQRENKKSGKTKRNRE